MNWVVNDPTFNVNNNVPDYLITLTVNAAASGEFDYLWGTARCANDVVYSAAPHSRHPDAPGQRFDEFGGRRLAEEKVSLINL